MRKFWIAVFVIFMIALFFFCVLFPLDSEDRAYNEEDGTEWKSWRSY